MKRQRNNKKSVKPSRQGENSPPRHQQPSHPVSDSAPEPVSEPVPQPGTDVVDMNSNPFDENGDPVFPPAITERGYTLGTKLGQGGFAKVFRARYAPLANKEIAVKIIELSLVPLRWKEKCLKVEMKIVKKMQHPHIIKVWELIKTRTRVYLFMDLAENDTVLGFMKKHRRACTEQEAQPWFSQVLGALSYMHNRECAHRDLKCENILLDRDFNAKLTDFGFACYTYDFEKKEEILSRTKCGTPAFMAPEVRNPPYDAKIADMWSMGAVLYEMVTFSKPFNENLPDRKILKQQQEKDWAVPASIKISDACREMLKGLLEPVVEERLTAIAALRKRFITGR